MNEPAPALTLQSMLEPNRLDECFPTWKSIEIFGAPGAGKSFLCRQLVNSSDDMLTTADDMALRHFVDSRMSFCARLLSRFTSSRLMKNYYKFQTDRMSRRHWIHSDDELLRYLQSVESALEHATLPVGSQKNVLKSVRSTGLSITLSYENKRPLLVDEGLVRKLITMFVQYQASGELTSLLDLLRECLILYPWEKNAVFVDAPAASCIRRQELRGHVIHGPGRFQSDQLDAAERVWELCRETGWKTIRLRNENDLPSIQAQGS